MYICARRAPSRGGTDGGAFCDERADDLGVQLE